MNKLINALKLHAQHTPSKIALQSGTPLQGNESIAKTSQLSYRDLDLTITELTHHFIQLKAPVIAVCVENHAAWVVIDLAAAGVKIPLVPIPFFFSAPQQLHALADAGVNYLITDRPEFYATLLNEHCIISQHRFEIAGKSLTEFAFEPKDKSNAKPISLPVNTAKVTYTSGTTGQPKGVCLSVDHMLAVAQSLKQAVQMQSEDVHLCFLPLATLLENIAGIYTPLLAGATIVLLSADDVGMNLEKANSGGVNPHKMLLLLNATKATTAILTPELLLLITRAIEENLEKSFIDSIRKSTAPPTFLRFLAVGGASISPNLLERAQLAGLPVFEGYGLSECCSVVALNTLQHYRIGSVGKPLKHTEIKFAKDGEILVKGSTLLGYTNTKGLSQASNQENYLATGDIGRLDEQGYLYIIGRKKNIFITSFGRNVSPEWVERELKLSPHIAQAILFGEAKPWNTLLVGASGGATSTDIQTAIDAINQNLPDYARVKQWLYASEPFTKANGQLTDNGRLRREAIWHCYETQINSLYEELIVKI